MNETSAFVYYEFYEVGERLAKAMNRIGGELNDLLTSLDALVERAKRENADPLAIETMITVYYAVQTVKNSVGEKLGVYIKMVAESMRSKLLNLLGNRICTYSDLNELTKRFGVERAIVECYKQNIVACRDAPNAQEGEKMIDVIYFKPDGAPDRILIRYLPGNEKLRYGTLPIILAVYEKCLGVKVDA